MDISPDVTMTTLRTTRLELVPMTLAMVEAVMLGRREDSEELARARMPERWPNRELIERAFPVSLDDLRADPAARLWGARVMVAEAPPNRRGGGSIVFHGRPGPDGIAEIAYGVEEASQRRGYATEAVAACVDWALSEDGVKAVQATSFSWRHPSLRVFENVARLVVGVRDH